MISFFLSNCLAPCTFYSSNHKVQNVHLWFDDKFCAFLMFLFPADFFSLNHNDIQIIIFQVTREVERRIEDLTHQVHREILARSVDQVKTLAPILICSMKIFIQIVLQGSWYISFFTYEKTLSLGPQRQCRQDYFISLKNFHLKALIYKLFII